MEIIGNGVISLVDTCLLYYFISLFLYKRNLSKVNTIFPFIIMIIFHYICSIFHLDMAPKIPILFSLDILFCWIQFKDKWYKYVINVALYHVIQTVIELFYMSIINTFVNFDLGQALETYDLSMFFIIISARIFMFLAILLIKSLMGRTVKQKQWRFFMLMPLLTIAFVWVIYPNYWNMGNPEIDKLLTYVGAFLVIQNMFVFFYVISLQSSTKQYIEMKSAYERQVQYSNTITSIQKAVRKMAHDIRHHFIYLMSALDQEDVPKAKSYLIELDENLDNMIPLNVTGHYDVDALLHAKARIAEKLDIHIRVEGVLPPEIMISPIDLSALLGNSLDNAIESASRVNGKKEITASFCYNAPRLNFTISNPHNGQLKRKANGYFLSQKGSGLGFEIMDSVVKKYDGALLAENDEENFTLSVMLQTQQPL